MTLCFRRLLLNLGFLFTSAVFLAAQSPGDKRWEEFIAAHPGTASLPKDEEMGLLADIRNPDPSWAPAIQVCESVFEAVEEGRVPSEVCYEVRRLPLTTAFTEVLEAGPRSETHRYGLPLRDGNRVTVPIRMTGGEQVVYGHVYLFLVEETWFIEQWALDLSGLPVIEIPGKEDSEAPSAP